MSEPTGWPESDDQRGWASGAIPVVKLAVGVPLVPLAWGIIVAATVAQACWRQGCHMLGRLLNPARQWPYPLLALMLCGGCADEIDRDALVQLPVYETQAYGFRLAVDPEVESDAATLGLFLDRDWYGWSQCVRRAVGMTPGEELARSFVYIIVPREFRCTFHDRYCGGEYHSDPPRRIFLAYETPAGLPIVYTWHEWSDIYFPETEDEEGRPCTRGL